MTEIPSLYPQKRETVSAQTLPLISNTTLLSHHYRQDVERPIITEQNEIGLAYHPGNSLHKIVQSHQPNQSEMLTQTLQHCPSQKNDFLTKIGDIVGRVPTRLQSDNLSIFKAIPDQPFINRFARLVTAFINRNFFWIRIFLILLGVFLLTLIIAPIIAL